MIWRFGEYLYNFQGSNDRKSDDDASGMGIDMPNLDHAEEQVQLQQSLKQQEQHSGPVSQMPSLDGDDSSHRTQTQHKANIGTHTHHINEFPFKVIFW